MSRREIARTRIEPIFGKMIFFQHLPVVSQAASPLVRHRVALKVILCKIVHCRFGMRVNALLQRIDAINNPSAQLNGALACGKGSEFGITSYRVATLAALKSVIQNERNRAVARDADTKSRNLSVVLNSVAFCWRL